MLGCEGECLTVLPTAIAFGEEKIMQWRKSFLDSPPTLADVETLTGDAKAAYMESLLTWDGTYSYFSRKGRSTSIANQKQCSEPDHTVQLSRHVEECAE